MNAPNGSMMLPKIAPSRNISGSTIISVQNCLEYCDEQKKYK